MNRRSFTIAMPDVTSRHGAMPLFFFFFFLPPESAARLDVSTFFFFFFHDDHAAPRGFFADTTPRLLILRLPPIDAHAQQEEYARYAEACAPSKITTPASACASSARPKPIDG